MQPGRDSNFAKMFSRFLLHQVTHLHFEVVLVGKKNHSEAKVFLVAGFFFFLFGTE